MRRGLVPIYLTVFLAGCWGAESRFTIVGDGAWGGPNPSLQAFHDPATEAIGLRVHQMGEKLLAANPDLPAKPGFQAIGSPTLEVFHRDTSLIYITQGLVNRCASDAELAAILCSELGRMMAQREAQELLRTQRSRREPPAAMTLGPDAGGAFGPADGTRLAELGKINGGRRTGTGTGSPPDPQILARGYLVKGGFAAADLDRVQPLLKEAIRNNDLERRLGAEPSRPWLP